jgi:thimet oligopeptidase
MYERTEKCINDLYKRRDIYDAISTVDKDALTGEDKRLADDILLKFKKNGIDLPDAERRRVADDESQIIKRANQLSDNITNDNRCLEATDSEIAGLPDSFIRGLKKNNAGNYLLPATSTAEGMLMASVTSVQTLEKFKEMFETRASSENIPLFSEILSLRSDMAGALGLNCYAQNALRGRMLNTPESVLGFLNYYKDHLLKDVQGFMGKLLKIKQEKDPKAESVHNWEIPYFFSELKNRECGLKAKDTQDCIDLNDAINQAFDLFGRLLGVDFIEEKAPLWHKDVRYFSISDRLSKEAIGRTRTGPVRSILSKAADWKTVLIVSRSLLY